MKLNVSEEIICKRQNHGSCCIKQMSPKPYIKHYKQQRDKKTLTRHQILKKIHNCSQSQSTSSLFTRAFFCSCHVVYTSVIS